jgi:translation initiation factor 4E
MIGEQFEEHDEICGAVINIRNKQDRISLWTKTSTNESAQMTIGRKLKQVLELPDNQKIGFTSHDDSLKMEKKAKV